MSTLKQGARGAQVIELQQALVAKGYTTVVADGIFGAGTAAAVRDYQKNSGLVVDGIVGEQTLNTLRGIERINNPKTLQQADFQAAADMLGVDVASIMAVTEVEARKSGFYPEGEPIVLFERHKLYKYISEKRGAGVAKHACAQNPNLCNPYRGGYIGGRSEWFRLQNACAIDRECALMSASFGLFQIMGFNHIYSGFDKVEDFVAAISTSEATQLQVFCSFVLHKKNESMLAALRAHNWDAFAELYNGQNYKDNDYDYKLMAAYRRYVALYPATSSALAANRKSAKAKTA